GVALAVVERRLASEGEVDTAVQARRLADEDVPGVGVARGSPVALGPRGLPVPRTDGQEVRDGQPAAPRLPRRGQHHRPRDVLAVRRDRVVGWWEGERAGGSVEDRAEDARVVRTGDAQP